MPTPKWTMPGFSFARLPSPKRRSPCVNQTREIVGMDDVVECPNPTVNMFRGDARVLNPPPIQILDGPVGLRDPDQILQRVTHGIKEVIEGIYVSIGCMVIVRLHRSSSWRASSASTKAYQSADTLVQSDVDP